MFLSLKLYHDNLLKVHVVEFFMVEVIKEFVFEFFKNLKCLVSQDGNLVVIDNVPKSFEDLVGKAAPYRLNFSGNVEGSDFAGKGSRFLAAMTKYLEGAGKATLLKIDFDVDPMGEISKMISLKNCEINNLIKKHKNSFFSRFTFMTTFRYLSEAEQAVNEVYVHKGKVVKGDLSGYTVVEGDSEQVAGNHLEEDYKVAREFLKELLQDKTSEIGEVLGNQLEDEIARVRLHYENLLSELGGDLNGAVDKTRDVELALRSAEGEERDVLRARLERLRKGLVKIRDDDSRTRILKEQEFTIKDAAHKHSLNIDNKLVNTTVIYYPVFSFNLFLKGNDSGRYLELTYDPLTKTLDKLACETCGVGIKELNLCSAGHIACENCLEKCGECGKQFCCKCMKRSCSVCGKALCKDCSIMCVSCSKYVCQNHIRKDCVSGDDRCVNCLRACMRCHGMAQEKYFGEAMDGSKVCQKCLGAEKRGKVMERVFREK